MNMPVLEVADELVAALRAGNRAILTAPTGSGKTTQLPQIVHAASTAWKRDGHTIVLQPRRLATRLVAARVAELVGSPLGGLVGYQTRRDSAVSRDTRIRFMTDGLFLRMLRDARSVAQIGAVILDEFHERSLSVDLSLGLLQRLQQSSRPDLRVLVMSATLDVELLQPQLNCPVIRAGGRTFPVEISYLAKPPTSPAWELAADAVDRLLASGVDGDGLVFMPGAVEIHRTIELLKARVGREAMVVPLHGSLSPREQDAAVSPAPSGRRKIIVATNVAETSITIEGIRFVVDSGTARIHTFDHRRGLNALHIEAISQASADQRAGRAGRTGPGRCIRLWTEKDHAQRELQTPPEVVRLDLSEAVLTLASVGVGDVAAFPWPTPPPDARVAAATELLHGLDALNGEGALTDAGRTMAAFPAHPRLARLLLEAHERGCIDRAAVWAAIIAERDMLSGADRGSLNRYIDPDEQPSDLGPRERLLAEARAARFDPARCDRLGVQAATARDIDHVAAQLRRIASDVGQAVPAEATNGEKAATQSKASKRARAPSQGSLLRQAQPALHLCVLAAYPDHVAFKPDAQKPFCIMPGRRKAVLHRDSVVTNAGFFVALDVQESQRTRPASMRSGPHLIKGRSDETIETTLALAARVDPEAILDLFPQHCETRRTLQWDGETKAVVEAEETAYRPPLLPADAEGPRELVLASTRRPCPKERANEAAEMLLERVEAGELALEHWNDAVEEWITRVRCVAAWFPERGLTTYDADDLRILKLEIMAGATRASQLRERPCLDVVRSALSWDHQQFVERMAPTRLPLPESWQGRPLRLAYTAPTDTSPPAVKGAAKIQDLYGLAQTPTVAGGRARVTLEILAPNQRPIQVTQDLAAFWANLYPEVKKELKRRYPKHEWR
jgi:ATP-dependent helicase HrpB